MDRLALACRLPPLARSVLARATPVLLQRARGRARILARLACVALLATACLSEGPAMRSRLRGGASGLERVPTGRVDELHRKPGGVLAGYRAVYIEPITFADDLETEDHVYRPRDLERLAERAAQVLARELEGYGLAPTPGPGVLRLRVLVTALRANRPPRDEVRHGYPQRIEGVGGAAAQLELRDARSDELLLAIVDRRWGYELSTNTNSLTTWGDVEDAFRFWGYRLRVELAKARARAGAAPTISSARARAPGGRVLHAGDPGPQARPAQ